MYIRSCLEAKIVLCRTLSIHFMLVMSWQAFVAKELISRVLSAFIGQVSDPYDMMATTRLSKSLSSVAMLSILEHQIIYSLLNMVHVKPRRPLRSSMDRLSWNPSIENCSTLVCLSRS